VQQPGDVIIRLDQVDKVYRTDEIETHALRGVSLQIRRGEYLSISGPSGCGKSTLLAVLGLLDSPSRGAYQLEGQPVGELRPRERARVRCERIGFVFQSFNLIGELDVRANVELPLIYRGVPSAARRNQVDAALERVGMTHRARHMPAQLSGGQQQRVAVARAVVGEPLLLLADEPTGNLDSANGEQVMELLRSLHQAGSTLCVVTHDPRYAKDAQRTLHLLDGRVLGEDVQ
jgi:putative ABC transport system ATP-binding protein